MQKKLKMDSKKCSNIQEQMEERKFVSTISLNHQVHLLQFLLNQEALRVNQALQENLLHQHLKEEKRSDY
jgi:hypothetical protein